MSYDSFDDLDDHTAAKDLDINQRARLNDLRIRFWDAKASIKRSAKTSMPPEPSTEPAKAPEKRLAFELMCGCGRLAAALQAAGFRAIGVDWKGNKDSPVCEYRVADLTTTVGQTQVRNLVQDPLTGCVTIAPPCGTASRAREIRRAHGPDPKPLRSPEFPDGLPDLTPDQQKRVDAANILYAFTAEVFLYCCMHKIACVIENPSNSLFWTTSFIRRVFDEAPEGCLDTLHTHMCMHGGGRNKKTKLLYCHMDLSSMELACDNSHSHKPWGLTRENLSESPFATAEERRYPALFCSRIAACAALACGTSLPPASGSAQGSQRQARRGFQIIDDFKDEVHTQDINALLSSDRHKLLHSRVDSRGQETHVFGVRWSTTEFVEKAKRTMHPYDVPVRIPED